MNSPLRFLVFGLVLCCSTELFAAPSGLAWTPTADLLAPREVSATVSVTTLPEEDDDVALNTQVGAGTNTGQDVTDAMDKRDAIIGELSQQMGITTVPLTIHFGEQSYRDGVDMTHKEFYRRLRAADTLPTTSQVNPAQFEDAFAPYLQNGDDIVIITISGKLSATNQSAQLVADARGGFVHGVLWRPAADPRGGAPAR